MELNRTELLRLLSLLEGKLQGSEIAIAALRAERIKQLFYSQIYSPSQLRIKYKVKAKEHNEDTKFCTIKAASNEDFFKRTLEIEEFEEENEQDKRLRIRQSIENMINDPLLALARDASNAYQPNVNESFAKNVYEDQVKQLLIIIRLQQKAKDALMKRLKAVGERYQTTFEQLTQEKERNTFFKQKSTKDKIDTLEKEKKALKEELDQLKSLFESEKEREKTMIVSLLAERKELIIRLIEESDKNDQLTKAIGNEQSKVAEMVEGLEEESKRSLQMELDLERLSTDHDFEIRTLKQKLQEEEQKNSNLILEIEELKLKITKSENEEKSPSKDEREIVSNDGIDRSEHSPKEIITTLNNIHNKNGSTNLFGTIKTPGRLAKSISVCDQLPNSKKVNFSPGKLSIASNLTTSNSASLCESKPSVSSLNAIKGNSIVSVIQKFQAAVPSTAKLPPPPLKKPLGLTKSSSISNTTSTSGLGTSGRGPPPVPPNKPVVNPQMLKDLNIIAPTRNTQNQTS